MLPCSIPPADLPDSFNHFFTDRIRKIRDDLDYELGQLHNDPVFHGSYLSEFHSVSEASVKELISKMPQTSCELDPIPASLFNDCINELIPAITTMMNTSLATGIVPQSMKHALVKPLLKKPNLDPECLNNYRPVSNLSFLSKVLERIVLRQLLDHLEHHSLLEQFQSAYRKCHSTETALVKLVNDLLLASDSGQVSLLALLDLSAAFDTLDHNILIKRLSHTFGFSGCVLSWLKSYITGRTQSVVIDGSSSARSDLQYGVPQGSVLGPMLFTMYIFPLSGSIKSLNINYHAYADDLQLYDSAIPSESPRLASNISCSIATVCSWMSENKLKMNENKTEIIQIGTLNERNKIEGPDELSVLKYQLGYVDKVKNLGVYLDSSLSFNIHIGNLCRALYLQLRRIGQIRPYLSLDSTKKLAVAFILSRMDYCNALLAGLPEDKIAKLQRIQNNAARLVLRKSKRDSATTLLRSLHWLPVRARIDYKIATLCHQCIYNDAMPSYLKELIPPYVPARSLRSKNSSLLVEPRFSLQTFGLRSFSVFGPKVWNSLPINLRRTSCLTTFKINLKTHYFKKYL